MQLEQSLLHLQNQRCSGAFILFCYEYHNNKIYPASGVPTVGTIIGISFIRIIIASLTESAMLRPLHFVSYRYYSSGESNSVCKIILICRKAQGTMMQMTMPTILPSFTLQDDNNRPESLSIIYTLPDWQTFMAQFYPKSTLSTACEQIVWCSIVRQARCYPRHYQRCCGVLSY